MTNAEEDFAEGFAARAEVHGKTCTFGAASFTGIKSKLEPFDPRLKGSADRLFEISALTSSLPSARPKRGDNFTFGGASVRVHRDPDDQPTGETIFLVS